jgi:hypothetical protein
MLTSTIESNGAAFGGGVYVANNAVIADSSIRYNKAVTNGGGLYVQLFTWITQTQISTNTAGLEAGGAYQAGPTSARELRVSDNTALEGGGAYVRTWLQLDRSSFARNRAKVGGGLTLQLINLPQFGPQHVRNSLFDGDAATDAGHAIYVYNTAGLDLIHNTLNGTGAPLNEAVYVSFGTVWLTNTLFHQYQTGVRAAAGFVDAANGDFHLGPASAARDAGAPTSVGIDFEGDPRPSGPAPDIGYDEQVGRKRVQLPMVVRQDCCRTYAIRAPPLCLPQHRLWPRKSTADIDAIWGRGRHSCQCPSPRRDPAGLSHGRALSARGRQEGAARELTAVQPATSQTHPALRQSSCVRNRPGNGCPGRRRSHRAAAERRIP